VVDDLHAINDKGSAALLVSLDLSAAFDCIDHEILIQRLASDFGVVGIASSWVRSFITGRTQRVVIGGSVSRQETCRWGVPQGSVLGPALFSLYTAPIERLMSHHQGTLHSAYADDVNIYSTIDPSSPGTCGAVLAARALYDWYICNGMLPNPDKSEAMLVGTTAQLEKFDRPILIEVAGCPVESRNCIKSLGVSIDSELSFNRRVTDLISSCNYHLRALTHIRSALDMDTALAVGRAIVLSRLDYCNALLSGTTVANVTRLQRLQDRLVRAVLRLPYRSNVSSARASLHWLPVRQRIDFKVALLAYTVRATCEPAYLAELLVERVAPRNLRSSSEVSLQVPRTRNKRRTRAFSSAAPLLWNSLPSHIRSCSTTAMFKSRLKTFLFIDCLAP